MRSAVVLGFVGLAALACAEPITIRMMGGVYGIPPKESTNPRMLARRSIFESFHRTHPNIRVVNAGGLELTGDKADSAFLMAMAGDTSPDIFYVNFRQYYNYIDQGFCQSLDDWVNSDPSVLSRANPIIMKVVRSYDGHIYAIPWYQVAQALYYRKDHYIEAGLDPNKPPKTWEEFYSYGKKLVESKQGREGFVFGAGQQSRSYLWSNFLWQAGGEVIEHLENGNVRSALDSPKAALAVDFYRKMVNETWKGADGKTYGPMAAITATYDQDIREGRASMWFAYTNDVMLSISDVNPSLLGVAEMPAGPGGHANEINAGMWAINKTVKDPEKVKACQAFIRYYASEEAAKVVTDKYVELGLASLLNPALLKRFGYEDLARSVDPGFVRANENLFTTGHPEPYGKNLQQIYTVVDNALDRAKLEPTTSASAILKKTNDEVNRLLLGYVPEKEMEVKRQWAAGIFAFAITVAAFFAGFSIRRALRTKPEAGHFRDYRGQQRAHVLKWLALGLAPAALSLLVWSYYPLLKGLEIAFQDYHVAKDSAWVGLDNFIAVFTQPVFYKSVLNSFLYVFLTILIGFFIPIFLAIALNEVPRMKVFWRTLFYLPAMTSPIVIAFLWRQFYDKSEQGILNALIAPFTGFINFFITHLGMAPLTATNDWLGDPKLAMFAVVLPGIWAGAGPGSILYLAALKNIPEERYEAADLDGANWWQKIVKITLPGLKPLMLINLLGVFIAGFKAMENVFVLTGGGPLYATHTMGLEIWTNAFMFLKFGYATAAAWVMGSILIGFTVVQIKNLQKVRFTTAKL